MQIISGKYARQKITSPAGSNVRPPLARYRKGLFDTLMPFLPRGPYLDFFGGTGSFAIEALSRGAPSATVVELNPRTLKEIQSNLDRIGVEEPVRLLRGDAFKWMPKLAEESESFGVIALAPPYQVGLEQRSLDAILPFVSSLLQEDGILFLQYPNREVIRFPKSELSLWKTKRYGTSSFSYFFKEDTE